MSEPPDGEEARVPVESDTDIVTARQKGRALATALGFSSGDATIVATAISELARNIVLYAKRGEIIIRTVNQSVRRGLTITAHDEGDGIADVRQAMQDGYSTSGRLGVGLPGVKRLMDEFEITSEVGRGTTVTVKKWKR
jgi:serine/threonine-protein kinase RsbT